MKKNIIKWLKENYNKELKYSIHNKMYCGHGNYLYDIDVLYNDGEIETLYIFISKNQNDLLNRIRGFDNNKSANNGIGLHNYYIDFYIWNSKKKYELFGW